LSVFRLSQSIIAVLFCKCFVREASRPLYVYSVGHAILSANVSVNSAQPHNLTVVPQVLVPKVGSVRTLGCLVAANSVYYGDTANDNGAIYRIDVTNDVSRRRREAPGRNNGGELTVQQPQVEGTRAVSLFYFFFIFFNRIRRVGDNYG
jgi:hypothetical protein